MTDKQCPSCGGNCGRTVKSGCMYDIPEERKSRRAMLEIQAEKIAELEALLRCVETNLSKGMSNSMQRLQAKTIREELK